MHNYYVHFNVILKNENSGNHEGEDVQAEW